MTEMNLTPTLLQFAKKSGLALGFWIISLILIVSTDKILGYELSISLKVIAFLLVTIVCIAIRFLEPHLKKREFYNNNQNLDEDARTRVKEARAVVRDRHRSVFIRVETPIEERFPDQYRQGDMMVHTNYAMLERLNVETDLSDFLPVNFKSDFNKILNFYDMNNLGAGDPPTYELTLEFQQMVDKFMADTEWVNYK